MTQGSYCSRVQRDLKDATATVNGKPVTSWMFATFMYDQLYDPVMPWVGFLRGRLIVQVRNSILLCVKL